MSTYKEKIRQSKIDAKALAELIPETVTAFRSLHDLGVKDGLLSAKTKELMALAIGIAVPCEGCILSHVSALVRLGMTREELGEALSAIFYMRGGPSVVYGAKALAVYDELTAK